jgi:hypothetical protein
MEPIVLQTLIISIASLVFLTIVILLFRDRITGLKVGNNEVSMVNKSKIPLLDEESARLYTRETVRLTNSISNIERKEILSAMMRYGEEGLTLVCNRIRADFREFIFSKQLSQEETEHLMQENEIVVRQLEREMHGWILLAMRQNCIPMDDIGLEKYVNEKFLLWDGESDEIRRQVGRNKVIHQEFLVATRPGDDRYIKIMTSFFRKAAKVKQEMMERLSKRILERQALEEHFVHTGKVKAVGCKETENDISER